MISLCAAPAFPDAGIVHQHQPVDNQNVMGGLPTTLFTPMIRYIYRVVVW